MSRSKKLSVLLGALLAVCLITFGVSQYEVHKEKRILDNTAWISLSARFILKRTTRAMRSCLGI